MAHYEMVATIVHQLTRNLTPEEIRESGFGDYYIDHTLGVWPQAAGGVPQNACEFQVKGDPITDIMEDMAADAASAHVQHFAIFNIFGMEKRHLAKTLACETLYIAAASFAGGLVLGIALDKAMYLLIAKIIRIEISLGFFVSGEAVWTTVLLFSGIFLLIYLYSALTIRIADPVSLLREGNAGEKEPKTKWLSAFCGLACVGGGYYIPLTVTNPLSSISMFFIAVLLVIAGTYLLFTAGSVALLKMLKKNKRYYYKTNHFVSISGMIYRMKQNAAGLANICILSTMVLVTLSFTSSLMIGLEEDETFSIPRSISTQNISTMTSLVFPPLSDYNAVSGEEKTLGEGEVLVYPSRMNFDYPSLCVMDRTYAVREKLENFTENGLQTADIISSLYIIAKDMDEIRALDGLQKIIYGENASPIRRFYGFDTNTGLYIACTAACFLIFAVLYVAVYLLTARTYDKIVS